MQSTMGPCEVSQFLRQRVALFAGLSDASLAEVVQHSELVVLASGEAIIELGEEGRFLGVLIAGSAEVSVTDEAGDHRRLGVLGPGDIFGEMSLMTGDRTMADVVCTAASTALLIPQAAFSRIVAVHPPAVRLLARMLGERSRIYGEDVTRLARGRADDPYGLALSTAVPARILVLDCGPSSLRYALFDTGDPARCARGVVEGVGADGTRQRHRSPAGELERGLACASHCEAFAAMAEALLEGEGAVLGAVADVAAVGHRVVHGGERFSASTRITDEVIAEIDAVSSLAPRCGQANLLGIREALKRWPQVPHVAVFDTAFHHTVPGYAHLYGLPYEAYERHRIRRYGFDGTSHKYAALKAAEHLHRAVGALEIVTCHLGNEASLCAVDHGRSVDTSMGFTPAEGLIMGSRVGDVDPGALLYLMRREGLDADQLDALLNEHSGLVGLAGTAGGMLEIEAAAQAGSYRALLAAKAFAYRVRKYIGAYAAAMGGIDVVVFTGGIGQGSAGTRALACQGLEWMGIHLDEERNRTARGSEQVCRISTDDSSVEVLVVPADEERMVARETLRTVGRDALAAGIRAREPMPIPIEVSAHHVHLTHEHVEALFGAGRQLTPKAPLSQPGQYACEEQVSLIGPKGRVERVRVLGPTRPASQVEIAMTEQFRLGILAPVRESGDIKGTPGITLGGPAGQVVLPEGVICAMRHVHMSPGEALRLGVRERHILRVRVGGHRELVFGDVVVRVSPSFRLAMHIDTDEANAAGLETGAQGTIDGVQGEA